MGIGVGSPGAGKFCILFGHLSSATIFPALKLTQNYYCIFFFLENWQFNHKLAPPLLHTCRKDHLAKYEEGKGTSKIPISQLL